MINIVSIISKRSEIRDCCIFGHTTALGKSYKIFFVVENQFFQNRWCASIGCFNLVAGSATATVAFADAIPAMPPD